MHLSSLQLQIQEASKYVWSSPQCRETWKSTIRTLNEHINHPGPTLVEKYLILDVPTRWNSTYFMLEQAYEYREVQCLIFPILECLSVSTCFRFSVSWQTTILYLTDFEYIW